ncbi:MAG: IspD/TarI family cytidylyltransferase [Kiritimatiellaeota bacterium]|nr:IspD/TarI family cytidylyltransferase [Kiritimatiellota bacterium]
MNLVTWGILVTCGKDERMDSGVDVPFLDLGGKPVLTYALQAFEQCADITGVVVVADKERTERVRGIIQMFGFAKVRRIVSGASQHMGTVQSALNVLGEDVSLVTLHSASRPCVTAASISETIKAARKDGAAAVGAPVLDPIKQIGKGGLVKGSVEKEALWTLQTPQTFRLELLRKAYAAVGRKHRIINDDTEALAAIGKTIRLIDSNRPNFRIRTPDDLMIAVSLLF